MERGTICQINVVNFYGIVDEANKHYVYMFPLMRTGRTYKELGEIDFAGLTIQTWNRVRVRKRFVEKKGRVPQNVISNLREVPFLEPDDPRKVSYFLKSKALTDSIEFVFS